MVLSLENHHAARIIERYRIERHRLARRALAFLHSRRLSPLPSADGAFLGASGKASVVLVIGKSQISGSQAALAAIGNFIHLHFGRTIAPSASLDRLAIPLMDFWRIRAYVTWKAHINIVPQSPFLPREVPREPDVS